ncbi:SRPBCC family protein [Amycolatopsis thermoflava]|uniref:SRPBCC family protein n=1 Tax=Amycolatopsis thermoflava TaxID=84480 RepID=UPI0038138071
MRIEETVEVGVPAHCVWAVAGDFGGLARWAPAVESSTVEGDVRIAVFAGGLGTARERILKRDDEARWYEYEYLEGPMPLQNYVSRLSVAERGAGSVVTWSAEFDAPSAEAELELGPAVAGMYRQALDNLRGVLSAS